MARFLIHLFLVAFLTVPILMPYMADAEDSAAGTQAVESAAGTQIVPFSISNPLKFSSLDKLITAIMGIVIQIMIPVITVMIIYTGFLFVTARGNETKITQAKQAFLYVIIGAAIMLGAFVIKTAITGTITQLQSLLPVVSNFYV